MRQISLHAWRLLIISAALQIVIFPLLNLYCLAWIAVAPMLVAILQAQDSETLHFDGQTRWLPATPWQGFLLGYVCGILWFAGTCYWIFDTMHRYGNLPLPAAALAQILFCMYVGLYHGFFGMLLAWVASARSRKSNAASPKAGETVASNGRALAAAPFLWVAIELARTRITAFPWELLGYSQTGNFALTRIAKVVGVYGLSFEILLVNSAFAATFLAPKGRRKLLLAASCGAAAILQAGQLLPPPSAGADRTALLVQPNVPILEGVSWTKEYFQATLQELTELSLHPLAQPSFAENGAGVVHTSNQHFDLIVWPESPAPFYTNDPMFRDAVSELARQSQSWIVAGAVGIKPAGTMTMTTTTPTSASTPAKSAAGGTDSGGSQSTQIYNSAALVNPQGEWVARYDKMHLVPFGEYLPFPQLFSFAGGLTKEVGEFQRGISHSPLNAGGERAGIFICYESIFPDEIRQGPGQGAQVLVNISNDEWYGDSGAWSQHLQQTKMRAIENNRWLLSDTNTGMTASIDPNGRIVASSPRKVRTALVAPYALASGTTFYTRHGDWFAFLCAIISGATIGGALLYSSLIRADGRP